MSELMVKEEAMTAAVFCPPEDRPSTYARRATSCAASLRWGGAKLKEGRAESERTSAALSGCSRGRKGLMSAAAESAQAAARA